MKIYILIILSLASLILQAQTIEFYGKIVTGSTPLYNISVRNLSQRSGVITDFNGDFKIPANGGDTIKFSSIGYKSTTYILSDTVSADKFRVLVNMVQDTVYLKETVIMPWPANRTMLKQAMLDTRKEKERIGSFAGFREIEGDPVEPKAKLSNPVSFIFDKLSKKSRQRKKIEKYRRLLQENDGYYEAEDEVIY